MCQSSDGRMYKSAIQSRPAIQNQMQARHNVLLLKHACASSHHAKAISPQRIGPDLRERAAEVLGQLRAALGEAAAAGGAVRRVGLRDRGLQRLPPRERRLRGPPRLQAQR